MIFGAAMCHFVKIPFLAAVLALLSHYFLDLFPHIEYPIENIKKRQWAKALPEFPMVFIDFLAGILLIYFFADFSIMTLTCVFFALLPDGFSLLHYLFPIKIFRNLYFLHEKIHFLKNKKISVFWRFLSQVLAIIISIIILQA
jgi:uncharacterized membrane protein HdeD (DUF308 family)